MGPIILQILLIFCNAVFASAEIAVISMREMKLKKHVEEGNKKAVRLLDLTSQPARFLATIQVAITLAGLLGSAYAAENFATPLVEVCIRAGVSLPGEVLRSAIVFLITLILAFFNIVFGEMVPKRIAMKNPEKLALGMSGLLHVVSKIFSPIVWLLTVSTNLVLRIMGINPDEDEERVTEEEIRTMLEAGSEEGTIDSHENEMIQNVFEFDDISIEQVCTHRTDVELLHSDESMEEWEQTICGSRHNFYPVCGERDDDIIGVLNTKDYFCQKDRSPEIVIQRLLEKPILVPESMKADVLFRNMKETGKHFAVVMDEYGGMSGIVTIHDLIEELVGELEVDENRRREIEKVDAMTWSIYGTAELAEVMKQLNVVLPEDYDTFGGYICGQLGKVPDDGTRLSLEKDGLSIEILEVEEHRIGKTMVHIIQDMVEPA